MKFKEEGFRTFFKGLGVTLLRAFPVNGIGFLSFQYLQKNRQIFFEVSWIKLYYLFDIYKWNLIILYPTKITTFIF